MGADFTGFEENQVIPGALFSLRSDRSTCLGFRYADRKWPKRPGTGSNILVAHLNPGDVSEGPDKNLQRIVGGDSARPPEPPLRFGMVL